MAVKSMSTKQIDSVAKVLGDAAYNDVFLYETNSERWTQVVITNPQLNRLDVMAKFGKDFQIMVDGFNDVSFYIANVAI